MRMLIVSPLPLYDRASGDLRLSRLLESLAARHNVQFCAVGLEWQRRNIGELELERYSRQLSGIGVQVLGNGVTATLRTEECDQVWFEFFSNAAPFIELARTFQPDARIVVDTVDVHFVRMLAKARLSGTEADMARALDVKARELEVYGLVDALITVTDQDAVAIRAAGVRTPSFTVPNVHPVSDPTRAPRAGGPRLVFVGSFRHGPNEDAVIYFCREILPLILERAPQTLLTIVGDAPSAELKALESEVIEVTGFVPETAPYLRASDISVAPLRFGAGMKGKIGEAMSIGLPVVTTSIGAEGFGLVPGNHLLVADDPHSFAAAVLQLHSDATLYERVRMSGHAFIRDNFGPMAVSGRALGAVDAIATLPTKSLGLLARARVRAADLYDRHLAWRMPALKSGRSETRRT